MAPAHVRPLSRRADNVRGAVEFRLLGAFEARHDGHVVDVGSRRQERCLLAVLVLEAGRSVPVARLVDLLWGDDAPDSARGTLQTYVARLRRELQPYGVRIVTRHDGYVVEPDGHIVDAQLFRALAGQAFEVREPGERARILDRALALWRGPLLADVADDNLRGRLGAVLEEQRLAGIELRAEAQLQLGQHDHVVAALTPLAEQWPSRERLIEHLMTALHRCGRQADALSLYRQTRRLLVDDLGIEPGSPLRTLHERILCDDDALRPPEVPAYIVRVHGQILPWAVGGHPALDFCNTYAGWGCDPPLPRGEWLRDYATLAVWAGYVDLVDERTTSVLVDEARRRPDEAAAALDEARTLRAHLHSHLTGAEEHRAFRAVADFAETAARMSVFDLDDDGLGRWSLTKEAGLMLPVHAAARAAADLLADPRRFTVRQCPSSDCGWLFLDQSGMRKWCSTATCGKAGACAAG